MALAALMVLAACAPPTRGQAGAPPAVHVLNGADRSITSLDASTGRPLGAPAAGTLGAVAIAPGPGGSLLLLSRPSQPEHGLTLTQTFPNGSERAPQRVVLPPTAGEVLLAAGAGPHAVVAYRPREREGGEASRCHLAVIDLAAALGPDSVRVLPLCGEAELVSAIAVDASGGRPVVYAALWRYRPVSGQPAPPIDSPAGRIVGVDLASGTVTHAFPLQAQAAAVALAPRVSAQFGEERALGGHLYVVENASGLEDEHSAGRGWRLIGLSLPSLTPEHVQPLSAPLRHLTPAPGGHVLYGISGSGRSLYRIDLRNRSDQPVASLPGDAVDLLATHDHVYAAGIPDRPTPTNQGLWMLERRTGRLTAAASGRGPIALATHHS